MIYVKSKHEGVSIKIVLTDNCFFSDCPVCGKETSVDYEIFANIVDDGTLDDTSVYCDPCSEQYRADKKPIIKRIK